MRIIPGKTHYIETDILVETLRQPCFPLTNCNTTESRNNSREGHGKGEGKTRVGMEEAMGWVGRMKGWWGSCS